MERLRSIGVVSAATFFLVALASPAPLEEWRLGALLALATGLALLFEREWHGARTRLGEVRFVRVASALGGGALGGLVGLATSLPMVAHDTRSVPYGVFILLVSIGAGSVLAVGFLHQWQVLFGAPSHALASPRDSYLIDTSTLIDGRIVELLERKVLVGNCYVPTFVLVELQQVADSERARTRGRRGLAVVGRLREMGHLIVKEIDKPEIVGADAKLKAIAKETGVTLMTNDSNLKAICESEDIPVLSLHEVANALRPFVFAGDTINVRLTKPGKKPTQAVAYLDDGDMVVVEDGKGRVGQDVTVIITKVIPQPTGRLIFAKIITPSAAASSRPNQT